MQGKKHKRKTNHVVIVTSDAVDADAKQFRFSPVFTWIVVVIACIVLGAVIGYFVFEKSIWDDALERNQSQAKAIETLTRERDKLQTDLKEQKEALETEIENLKDRVKILSDTVQMKDEREAELTAILEKQSTPTEFPLTGSASMEIPDSEEPVCLFVASEGTYVIAAANGTVTSIEQDEENGCKITVDHGNGYVSIYMNKSSAMVTEGVEITQGTKLFQIGKKNKEFKYQIMKDNRLINPVDMLSISG